MFRYFLCIRRRFPLDIFLNPAITDEVMSFVVENTIVLCIFVLSQLWSSGYRTIRLVAVVIIQEVPSIALALALYVIR